jgi:hypothetical protein
MRRVYLEGQVELWKVKDLILKRLSSFADDSEILLVSASLNRRVDGTYGPLAIFAASDTCQRSKTVFNKIRITMRRLKSGEKIWIEPNEIFRKCDCRT